MPGACKRRATKPGGMHRQPAWHSYSGRALTSCRAAPSTFKRMFSMGLRRRRLSLGVFPAVLLWIAAVPAAAGDFQLVRAVKAGDPPAALRSTLGAGRGCGCGRGGRWHCPAWASHRDDLEAADLLIRGRRRCERRPTTTV